MKRTFFTVLLFITLSASALLGCANDEEAPELTVTAVIAGNEGCPLYDSAKEGLFRLQSDFRIQTNITACDYEDSNYKPALENAANESELIIAVGQQLSGSLKETAPEYPEKKFVYIDNSISGEPNVFSIKFAQNEAAFLAGYIASTLSNTQMIGAVNSTESPASNDFFIGYEQGARYANIGVKVRREFSGSYTDSELARECADRLYEEGCDVILAAADGGSFGVIESASEHNRYAIGTDSDQKHIAPEAVLCSVKKEIGELVYQTTAEFINGSEFRGGETWLANLESGLIGISYGDDASKHPRIVPNKLQAEVRVIQDRIISGDITVRTAMDQSERRLFLCR